MPQKGKYIKKKKKIGEERRFPASGVGSAAPGAVRRGARPGAAQGAGPGPGEPSASGALLRHPGERAARAGRGGGARRGERSLPGKTLIARRALSKQSPGARNGQSGKGCLGKGQQSTLRHPKSSCVLWPGSGTRESPEQLVTRTEDLASKRSPWYAPVLLQRMFPALGVPPHGGKVNSAHERRGCARSHIPLKLG